MPPIAPYTCPPALTMSDPDHVSDHLAAQLGEDPFALAEAVRLAARKAGRARVAAADAERKRKVCLALAASEIRSDAEKAGGRTTEARIDQQARASQMYQDHVEWQAEIERSAADADADYYALRNRQDWLQIGAQALRAETYLAR